MRLGQNSRDAQTRVYSEINPNRYKGGKGKLNAIGCECGMVNEQGVVE